MCKIWQQLDIALPKKAARNDQTHENKYIEKTAFECCETQNLAKVWCFKARNTEYVNYLVKSQTGGKDLAIFNN